MPSRKKRAQAKARKAARAIAKAKREEEELQQREQQHHHHTNLMEQEEKEAEENFEEVSTVDPQAMNAGQQQPCVELDTTAIVGPSTILTNVREPCNHGHTDPVKDRSYRMIYIYPYEHVLNAVIDREEIYEEIYFKAGEMMESYILDTVAPWMKKLISYFIWEGTEELILNGTTSKHVIKAARYISYFEHTLRTFHLAKPGIPQRSGFIAPGMNDAHTLVRFFQKRIPCACLDSIYEKVKSTAKLSICHNPSCILSDRTAARSEMFYCARCKQANYCSRECQKADWKRHKKWCNYVTASLDAADYDENEIYEMGRCDGILLRMSPSSVEVEEKSLIDILTTIGN